MTRATSSGTPHRGVTSFPSPNWLERRTFTYIFFFEPKPLKKEKSPRYYRNPISLAKEYKRMIETGEVKNQSALARKLGVSRVRICQVLSLLKLDSELIKAAEQLGDPMLERIITEKMLREYLKNPKTHNNMLYRFTSKLIAQEKNNTNIPLL